VPEPTETDAYHALCAYTLGHRGAGFIHQHVVDAFAAQHADPNSKPIGVAFALVGLYLMIEKGLSGREVQRAHMQMGRHKRAWPSFPLPTRRGSVTAVEVMAKPEGPERDQAIHAWCASVWSAYAGSREAVDALLREYGVV
jgi:hypothetical protein